MLSDIWVSVRGVIYSTGLVSKSVIVVQRSGWVFRFGEPVVDVIGFSIMGLFADLADSERRRNCEFVDSRICHERPVLGAFTLKKARVFRCHANV
jgi:hypothetical protein